MNQKHKKWIDNASYYDMLVKWRKSPIGSESMFNDDETSKYFIKIMYEKKALVDHVKISKEVGW